MGNALKLLLVGIPSPSIETDVKGQSKDPSITDAIITTLEVPPPPPPPPSSCRTPFLAPFVHHHHHPSPYPLSKKKLYYIDSTNNLSLLELIARRDWQQVLIRATLRPLEMTQWHVWNSFDDSTRSFDILPLHLACALQPPPQVIAVLLQFHSDAARTWMSSSSSSKRTTSSLLRQRGRFSLWVQKYRRWRPSRSRQATSTNHYSILSSSYMMTMSSSSSQRYSSTVVTPSDQGDDEDMVDDDDESEEDCISVEDSLEDTTHFLNAEMMETRMIDSIQEGLNEDDDSEEEEEEDDDDDDVYQDALSKTSDDDENQEDVTSSSFHVPPPSLSSASSSLPPPVVLQLTASGGLESLTLKESKSIEGTLSSTTDGATTSHPVINNNHQPHEIHSTSEKIQLLPIHVACFYQASPQVIRLLLETFPDGARTMTLGSGMLPIHLLCSGGGGSKSGYCGGGCANSVHHGHSISPKNNVYNPIMPGEMFVDPLFMSAADDFDFSQALSVLIQAYPESRSVKCRRLGKTPLEHAQRHFDGCWTSSSSSSSLPAEGWQWLLHPDNHDYTFLPRDNNVVDSHEHHHNHHPLFRWQARRTDTTNTAMTTPSSGCGTKQRLPKSSCKLITERNFVDILESSSYDSVFADDSSDTANSSIGVPMDFHYYRSMQQHNRKAQPQPQHPSYAGRRHYSSTPNHSPNEEVNDELRHVNLFGMLLSQEWEDALALVEEDPSQASVWHHGIDKNNVPWKRLALHLACAWDAPVGLIQVILEAFGDGVTAVDPYDGSLPLHVACQVTQPNYQVVQVLLLAFSKGTKATDLHGRCPLHYAAMAAARSVDPTDPIGPFAVMQALVQEDPESALCRDLLGKTPLELVFSMPAAVEGVTVINFLQAIQKALSEGNDNSVYLYQGNHAAVEPGSHREV